MSLRSSTYSPKPLGVPDPSAGFGVVVQHAPQQASSLSSLPPPPPASAGQQQQQPNEVEEALLAAFQEEAAAEEAAASAQQTEHAIDEDDDDDDDEEEEDEENAVPEHPVSIEVTNEVETLDWSRADVVTSVVSLVAVEDFPMPKPDLDVVVVVNKPRSAETLENYRQSLEYLIGQLGPNDRIALIAYEDEAQVILELDFLRGAEKLNNALAAIETITQGQEGHSNLAAGLKRGLQFVEAKPDRLSVWAVLLLCDEAPSSGPTETDAILQECGLAQAEKRRQLRISQRVPSEVDHPWVVSTFGYGSAHNPDLLKSISEAAKGVYYYVPPSQLISNALADAYGGLVSTVAVRVEVAVRPVIGVNIRAMHTDFKVTEFDNGLVVDVADLHRGEKTNIVVDVFVDALQGEPVGQEQQLVDIHVKYLDMRYHDPHIAQTRVYTSIDVFRPTASPPQLKEAAVEKQQHRLAAVKLLRHALEQSERGTAERKKAASKLRKLVSRLEVSDVAEDVLIVNLRHDLNNLASLLRSDRSEEWRKILLTILSQYGTERSVARSLGGIYATPARSSAVLRVGRSLKQALSRLLQSARYSDVEVAGHKLHKCILGVRAPKLLEKVEVAEKFVDALRIVIVFIYTGEYLPPTRRGEKSAQLRFGVLDLAQQLELHVLAALVRRELIQYLVLDISAVKIAMERKDQFLVDHFIYKFVYQPDHRTQQITAQLQNVPALLPRIFSEFREAGMERPQQVEVPARSLESDIASLFESSEHSDLTIKVSYRESRSSFKVHRAILLSRAPWFSYLDLSNTVELPIPIRSFRALLVFLYTDQPPADITDALNIIAHYSRSGIDSIEIAKTAIARIDATNCYEAYDVASRLKLDAFAEAALDKIEDSFQATTRDFIVQQQKQLQELRSNFTSLAARVLALEEGDSDNDDDDDEEDDRD